MILNLTFAEILEINTLRAIVHYFVFFEEFIALFKRIVSKTIKDPEESEIFLSWGPLYSNEVIWALMRAWKLEDEDKGKELFESLGQDFQSFLKEDAEIDGVYLG